MYAGAVSRDADTVAALFTDDGVYDAPLAPDGHPLHRRLVGRDAIRAGIGAYHRQPAYRAAMNPARTTVVLHDTTDPDVFVAELDVVFDDDGRRTRMSLVQIFRVRDGRIVMLRDYFTEQPSPDTAEGDGR